MGSLEATHRQRSVFRFPSRHGFQGDRKWSVCWRVCTDCKFAGSRDHLPTISFFTKDGSGYTSRNSTVSSPTPLVSPTTMYPSQPSPYSYQPSAASAPPQPGYISPPESRRALEEEKEKQLQPQRQSLPSIHEALRNDSPLPYPAPPTSGPLPQAHPHPPHALVGRSAGDGPAGPPTRSPTVHQQAHTCANLLILSCKRRRRGQASHLSPHRNRGIPRYSRSTRANHLPTAPRLAWLRSRARRRDRGTNIVLLLRRGV